jgi:uncharacterized membrane protein YpjA
MLYRILFWFIILVNLGGAAFGFFVYYGQQFLETSPLLWIFVGDCPLFALMFALAFYLRADPRPKLCKRIFGRCPDLTWLWFLTIAGAMKYGFWTIFVLSVYSPFYFTPQATLLYTVLFGSHLFLLFETTLLVGKIRVRESFLAIALAFLLANDLSDYLLGTHPPLPEQALGFMFPASMAMSLVFTILAYLVLGRYSRN